MRYCRDCLSSTQAITCGIDVLKCWSCRRWFGIGLDKSDSALALLAEAVELAVPKGGVGLFMGYDKAIEQMVRRLEKQSEFSQSAGLLLAAFAADDSTPNKGAPAQDLPEPLTDRELDVLVLLAERLTNKEIAHQLVVSTNTVRNHIANIFGKLQVHGRVQAVERARELGLLPEVA